MANKPAVPHGRIAALLHSPVDLEAEEKRQRIVANRSRRFFGPAGLVAKFELAGDPLYELWRIIALVIVISPELLPAQIIRQFVADAREGAFPDGFRDYGAGRRAVHGLLDLHNFKIPMVGEYSLRPGFTTAQYVLRPSVHAVGEAPEAMRACRSVWRRWLVARGWPVPSELCFIFNPNLRYTDNFRRYFRTLSAVEQARAPANRIVNEYLKAYPGSSSELRPIVAEERNRRGLK